jgi:FkbM family methyltransferase
MLIEVDGLEIWLNEAHDRQVLHIKNGAGYERDSLEMWARMVKRGAVAIDVGAYTGLFSIIAALRGAKVIALEPMPANFWRMRVNVARNKARGVTMLATAASDHEGSATLHYNPKVALTTGASLEDGIASHAADIVVKCITIDSLGLEDVAAIKIDVERHEPCVIRGAMQTIERDKPALLIETLDVSMRKQLLDLLPSYEAATILDGRNTLFTRK